MAVHAFAIEIDGQYLPITGEIALNQSRVQLYQRCKRKFWWQWELGLLPDRPQWNLEIGLAVHEALAQVAAGKSLPSEAPEIAEKHFLRSIDQTKFVEGDEELFKDSKDIIQRVLPAYFRWYGEDAFPWQPMGVEVKGRVPVGDPSLKIFLVFRTDLVVLYNGLLWLIDHKTMKKLDERDLMKYEMDIQITAYIYGIMAVLKRPVAGVIINGLVKTQTPQFVRDRYLRSVEELREFEAEWVEIANEIRWRRARVAAGENPKTVFYKNTSECFNYGTCWYRALCIKDNEAQRAAFVQRKKDYVDDPGLLQRPSWETPDTARPDTGPRTSGPVLPRCEPEGLGDGNGSTS